MVRTWLYATPNEGVARKTLGHLSFMASSVLLGWRASGPADVVVVSSPTFFSILSGWLLARLKRARFVVEVRDLWPAIFVELGVLTNRRVIRLLERLELAAYAAADQVVVVSEGFRGRPDQARGAAGEGAHDQERRGPRAVRPGPGSSGERHELRARLGAGPGDCLVLYAGTHGISQALPAIADAAALLDRRAIPGGAIRFAFVGDGADKKRLERRVAELGLGNVVLLPGVPNAEMPALLAAADICLVPLRKVPLFATFIPSKMFEYLAAGKAGDRLGHRRGGADPGRGGRGRGPAGRQRLARGRDRRAGRRPAVAGGDRPDRPGVRGAALRPGGAGPGVPQDPGPGPFAAAR